MLGRRGVGAWAIALGLSWSCGDDGESTTTDASTTVPTTIGSGTNTSTESTTGESTGSASSTGSGGTQSTTGGPVGCEDDLECEPDEVCDLETESCEPAGNTWGCKWLCMRQVACRLSSFESCMTGCENIVAFFEDNPGCVESYNQLWYCAGQIRDCELFATELACGADVEICADECNSGECG